MPLYGVAAAKRHHENDDCGVRDEDVLPFVFALLRSFLAVIAGIVLFVAGHEMRGQGSGIPFPYGLLAYGLALLAFAYAVPPLEVVTRWTSRD